MTSPEMLIIGALGFTFLSRYVYRELVYRIGNLTNLTVLVEVRYGHVDYFWR